MEVCASPEISEIVFDEGGKNYRMILGVRTDLKMQKGKVAAQCGHAVLSAYRKAQKRAPSSLNNWLKYGQAKITVKINDEEEMLSLRDDAKKAGVLQTIIHDAGHTQVKAGSATVIAFGPAPKDVMDRLTGHLKLY